MIQRVTGLASFLPALLHELTHYAASKPWAAEAEIQVDVTGTAAVTRVHWDESAPRAIRIFAHLAPTIMGFGGGAVVVLYWALNGFALPAGSDTWARLALACVVWCVYTAPSRGDIRGAMFQ